MVLKLPLLALVYVVVGLAAMQISIPPSSASPLYPSAGIAVAAALVWGMRVLPVIFLSSVVHALLVYGPIHGLQSFVIVLAVTTGAGAALQAGVAAWLVRRFVSTEPRLDNFREFFMFGLLAGPIACILNATVSLAGMQILGILPASQFPVSWIGWWLGDSVGVLIAAPVTLAFIGRPRKVWAPRVASVAMPMILVTALVAWGIVEVLHWEEERRNGNFRREADLFAQGLKAHFSSHIDALRATHGLLEHDPDVSRDEFRTFTAPWLDEQPSLQALGWSARVAPRGLDAFERRVRESGRSGFTVFNRDPERTRPGPDEELLVITYAEPEPANTQALGANTLSIEEPSRAVALAADSFEPVATSGFRLTQETDDQIGVVIYMAVRGAATDTPAGSTREYLGVVFATLRMQDVIDDAMRTVADQLRICLMDVRPDGTVMRLAGMPGCEAADELSGLSYDHAFAFAGRTWHTRITASAGFGRAQTPWGSRLFGGVSLLTIVMLGVLLLSISGRTRRIEAVVEQRTRQLSAEVTERRAKEQALQESEKRFRNVFDHASVGLAYCDLSGRVLRANPRFCEIAGHDEASLRELGALDMVHPEDRRSAAEDFARLISGEVTQMESKRRYIRSDGSSAQVRVRLALERDAEGEPLRVVAVVEDVREELLLQEAERAREVAEAANLAKDDFVSQMSHELRTPLNAILGHAQLLALDRRKSLTPDQSERVNQIQTAGWFLLEMINDILDLSRIEAGTMQVVRETVDVNAQVRECLSMLQEQLADFDIRADLALADDAAAVEADPTRLKQVLTNLLSNAIKYNVRGGSISVRTRRRGDRVYVQVSDTGMGMTRAQLARLYEPFNRLGRETSGKEGAGIGLVVARSLIQLMDGRIEVQSTPNVGSSFTVELPAATQPFGPVQDQEPKQEAAGSGVRGRVYSIEDNLTNAAVLRGFLAQRPGIQLKNFIRGREGLEATMAEPPDLLLLDIALPDLGGIEILRLLRAHPGLEDLPVIVLSAGAMEQEIEEARAAGATDYLTKPLDVGRLLSRVDSILGSD
ncbi:CHASE domain-containing protein [Elongatibacter sediminis]|uniref:histidine kinase n=1 Tax=Elongatibacter sediminis TaxID=3119006 RepID=A0AAW9RFT4_9GAMM